MKYSQSAVQERAYLHTVAIKQHTGHTNPHTRGIHVVVAYVLRMPTTHLHRRRMHAHYISCIFCIPISMWVVLVQLCKFLFFVFWLQYAMHNKTLPRKKQNKRRKNHRDTLADFSFRLVVADTCQSVRYTTANNCHNMISFSLNFRWPCGYNAKFIT